MEKYGYNKWINYATYIFPCVIIGSLIEMYLGLWAIDTIIKILAIFISFSVFFHGGYRKEDFFASLTMGYIAYCLLTGFSYLWNNRPFSCYYADISDYVLPIFFVFVGLKDNKERVLYDRFLKYLIPIFVLGIICFMTTPAWYTVRLAQAMNSQWYLNSDIYDEETILSATRFTAFFRTSYPVSHFVSFGMSIVCFNSLRADKEPRFLILSFIVLIIVAFLSQHRVAIACMVLYLGFTIIYAVARKKTYRIWPLFIILGFGITSFVVYGLSNDRFNDVLTMVSERVEDMSVSNAMKERKQIKEVMSSWDNIIFGQGIGSGGPSARAAGYYGITDQNYVKLLYETGLMGCLYLLLIFASTLIRAIKFYKYYLTELMIVVFVLIAMLGSNSLVIYYTYIIMFWYAVGRIWNRRYLQLAINKNIRI